MDPDMRSLESSEMVLSAEERSENHSSISDIVQLDQEDAELLEQEEELQSSMLSVLGSDRELAEIRAEFGMQATPTVESDLKPPATVELLMSVEESVTEEITEEPIQPTFTFTPALPETTSPEFSIPEHLAPESYVLEPIVRAQNIVSELAQHSVQEPLVQESISAFLVPQDLSSVPFVSEPIVSELVSREPPVAESVSTLSAVSEVLEREQFLPLSPEPVTELPLEEVPINPPPEQVSASTTQKTAASSEKSDVIEEPKPPSPSPAHEFPTLLCGGAALVAIVAMMAFAFIKK